MSRLERIYYLHQQIMLGGYPDASSLIRRFEISRSTAHRDIEYLRDRLSAPLVYDRKKKGYEYESDGFALPFERSPSLLFLFALLNRLAEDAGLDGLPGLNHLQEVIGRLYATDYKKLAKRIHCERIEVESVSSDVIKPVITSFHDESRLAFSYEKLNNETSFRTVDPLRIVNYQGRWYLFAYCHMRASTRMFHMARMRSPEVLKEACAYRDADIDHFLLGAFGIFKGNPVHHVKILFKGSAAGVVRNQIWHKDQRIENNKEGVVLSLPAADFTEIKMKILQYGCQARVLEPPELREEIASEIRRMHEAVNEIVL